MSVKMTLDDGSRHHHHNNHNHNNNNNHHHHHHHPVVSIPVSSWDAFIFSTDTPNRGLNGCLWTCATVQLGFFVAPRSVGSPSYFPWSVGLKPMENVFVNNCHTLTMIQPQMRTMVLEYESLHEWVFFGGNAVTYSIHGAYGNMMSHLIGTRR